MGFLYAVGVSLILLILTYGDTKNIGPLKLSIHATALSFISVRDVKVGTQSSAWNKISWKELKLAEIWLIKSLVEITH